jgi:uncharacterized membrane protein
LDGWDTFWAVLIASVVFGGVIWIFFQWFKFYINKNNRPPLDIARARYARGEITKDELEEIKRNLK